MSYKLVAEYILVGKYIKKDNELAYKYLRESFLHSDFWAMVTLYEYNKYVRLKTEKDLAEKELFSLAKKLFDSKHKMVSKSISDCAICF